jgi:hypothetical protein
MQDLGYGAVCGSSWETAKVIQAVGLHEGNGRQDRGGPPAIFGSEPPFVGYAFDRSGKKGEELIWQFSLSPKNSRMV